MSNSELGFTELVAGLEHAFVRDVQGTRQEDLLSADAALTHVLVQLRRHLHTLRPVAKLPPELLSRIFASFMRLPENCSVYSLQDSHKQVVHTAPLLTLTHICYHWRSVAFNTPALWTRVDDRHAAQLEAFVSRSQLMPLSVVVDASRLNTTVLAQCGSRLRRLDILINDSITSIVPLLRSVLGLPLLECVTVLGIWRTSRADVPPGQMAFGHPVSHLKALALIPAPSWGPEYHFPDITHLHLGWPSDSREDAVSHDIYELAFLFIQTPALQYLHLTHMDYFEEDLSYHGSPPKPVLLSSLRTLTCVQSNMTSALYLLSFLAFPDTAIVRLDALERTSPMEADFSPRTASPGFTASCSSAQLVMDEEALFLVAEGPRSGLWIQGRDRVIDVDDDSTCWRSFMSGLERLDVLPSIRRLAMMIDDKEDAFVQVLSRTHSLEHLTVIIERGNSLHTQVNARAAFAALSNPTTCPRLHTLVLLYGTKNTKSTCPAEMAAMLKARAGRGQRLRRLALQQWWTSTKDPDALEVEQQRWNTTFQSILPRMGKFVDVVELASGEDVRPFVQRDIWNVDGAEDYWEIPSAYQPAYRLPPHWPIVTPKS